jgi:hypothetical protein
VTREGWRAEQRVTALLRMIREDGANPAGEVPPAAHLEAVENAPTGRAEEVAKAHREGRGPPDHAQQPDGSDTPDSGGGSPDDNNSGGGPS